MTKRFRKLTCVYLLVFTIPALARQPQNHFVTVNADGSFSPQRLFIHDGDTVTWTFSKRTDTIIPVDSTAAPDWMQTWKPYDPADPNEFTGPMPQAVSGIFTLGPDGNGFAIDSLGSSNPQCDPNTTPYRVGNQFLCNSGDSYATMDWTWQNPNITGVFIRLRWNTVHKGPGVFDWRVMDREIAKAVRSGKMYSLSFKAGSKGTPDWIFDPAITGSEAVKPLKFQDAGDNPEPGQCGTKMTLGSPADANYRKHYFDLWRAAAQHIREKNAWYRALAYVKPSGMNLFSHENRLPNRCEADCNICNPQVWAEQGGYKPSVLYDFYHEQTALLADEFPGKDMSYMLIQAGFPKVNENGEYQQPLTAPLPGGTEQTEKIIQQGIAEHGLRFVVQHNGLGVKPQDRPIPRPACPNEGVHPAAGPFAQAGSGCPNRWVLQAGEKGQVTGFQTNNAKGVANAAELESTLENAWDNSDAIFVEIYEQLFWAVETGGPVLDPSRSGLTIGEWAERFHERRRDFWGDKIPEPFPLTYSHVFTRTNGTPGQEQRFYYVNSAADSASSHYGVITILPDKTTSVADNRPDTPGNFRLVQNFPNPFNPTTTISYHLKESGTVELKIYDTLGKIIRTLVHAKRPAGSHEVVWDGRDDAGNPVPSGQYFVELQAGNAVSSRKLLLAK